MVAEGTDIDTFTGIQCTEWVELETFLGGIALFAGNKEEELLESKRHMNGIGEISFWTHRSRLDSRHTVASIACHYIDWKML